MGFPVLSSGTLPVAVPGLQREVAAVLRGTVEIYHNSTADSMYSKGESKTEKTNEFVYQIDLSKSTHQNVLCSANSQL